MGKYATITSISNHLPDFLDGNTTTSDEIGKNVFSACIDKAEAYFDAAVASRYELPFATGSVPPLARELSFDMAAYFAIRSFSSRDWPNRNELLDDFKMAFDMLKEIKDGKTWLTDTDGSLISRNTNMMATNREDEDSIFDVDDPTSWKVDKDREDDLSSARD